MRAAVLLAIGASLFALQAAAADGSVQPTSGAADGGASDTGGTTSAEADTSEPSLDQVVVTAERRPESEANVPISITAISAATIDQYDIQDFTDYAQDVPNLSFGLGVGGGGGSRSVGPLAATGFSIRGISGYDTTAFYIDDTPLPDSLDPRVIDMDHIEVLRGPQGTLFGASSMGGMVRVITQQPNPNTFSTSVDVQGFGLEHAVLPGGEASVVTNLPLVEDLAAARLSAFESYTPGYFSRTYNDPLALNVTGQPVTGPAVVVNNVGAENEEGVGLTLRVTPTDGLVLTPMVRWQKTLGDGFPLADYNVNNLVQRRILNQPETDSDDFIFSAFTASYTVPFGRFVSSTSWLHRDTYDLEDGADANSEALSPTLLLPGPGIEDEHNKTFTEEDRFESAFDIPLQLVAGVFYQRVYNDGLNNITMPGLDTEPGSPYDTDIAWNAFGSQHTSQLAGYAGLTYTPVKPLELQAGGRESHLTNANSSFSSGIFGTGAAQTEVSESAFTPRFSANYHIDPQTMVYTTAAQGFREGGANGPLGAACGGFGFSTTEQIPYGSDSLWSYELGVKEAAADNRWSLTADGYHIDWSRIQQSESLSNGANGCFAGLTLNLGTAHSDGGELEANARVTERLSVHLAAGIENAHLTQVGPHTEYYVGEPLSGVPRWTGSATGDYEIPAEWGSYFVRAQYSYTGQSESYTEVATGLERDVYQLVNLWVGANYHAYTASLFVKNLSDARPNLSDEVPVTALASNRYRFWVGLPREIGVELRTHF